MSSRVLARARELAEAGEVGEARQLLNEFLEENPSDEAAYLLYVDLLAESDVERYEALRQFLALHPGSAQVARVLSRLRDGLPPRPPPSLQEEPPPPVSPEPPAPSERQIDPQTAKYFTHQPPSVSPRYRPGAVSRTTVNTILGLAGIGVVIFLLLPIWGEQNFFRMIGENIPTLVAQVPLRDRAPETTPTPAPNSILFADLSPICLEPDDMSAGYRLVRLNRQPDPDRLKSYEQPGLRLYFGNEWAAQDQPALICEVLVYESQDDAILAFSGLRLSSSRSDSAFEAPRYGDDYAGNLVLGAQYVFNYAYRRGRTIVKLTTISGDRSAALETLETLLPVVDGRLDLYSHR